MTQFRKSFALWILRIYKLAVSPWLPPACRYVPTCSEYAMEAIDHFGLVRGSSKAVLRLLRCHPFADGGYDPVMKIESGGHPANDCSHDHNLAHGT
ncbi:MAG TPA: membrane protein insertion efficiency factor YidD [Candidatus Sulfotelmatobacter sp.]|nr:membrane protein insertion efficiency factor YidD [Candidatus Sulfotelmatobacter sp.]